MHRTTRIVASTLAIAALGVVGSQTGASATTETNTCSHGVVPNNSGHKWVAFISSRDVEDAHIHKYLHNTGLIGDHIRERNC
jgi:hypothetical protein